LVLVLVLALGVSLPPPPQPAITKATAQAVADLASTSKRVMKKESFLVVEKLARSLE
jgi:hypothetical protein